MGRSFLNSIPRSGRDDSAISARLTRTRDRKSARLSSLARIVFMSTVAAVVIRALSRRPEYQLHLQSLQESLDVPLSTDDLTLFSPPAAIAQEETDSAADDAEEPPSSAADDPALLLQFRGNQVVIVESLPGDGSALCPVDHPVKGTGGSSTYTVPSDPGYEELVPTVCFISAAAAERAGFRHAGTTAEAPSREDHDPRDSDQSET